MAGVTATAGAEIAKLKLKKKGRQMSNFVGNMQAPDLRFPDPNQFGSGIGDRRKKRKNSNNASPKNKSRSKPKDKSFQQSKQDLGIYKDLERKQKEKRKEADRQRKYLTKQGLDPDEIEDHMMMFDQEKGANENGALDFIAQEKRQKLPKLKELQWFYIRTSEFPCILALTNLLSLLCLLTITFGGCLGGLEIEPEVLEEHDFFARESDVSKLRRGNGCHGSVWSPICLSWGGGKMPFKEPVQPVPGDYYSLTGLSNAAWSAAGYAPREDYHPHTFGKLKIVFLIGYLSWFLLGVFLVFYYYNNGPGGEKEVEASCFSCCGSCCSCLSGMLVWVIQIAVSIIGPIGAIVLAILEIAMAPKRQLDGKTELISFQCPTVWGCDDEDDGCEPFQIMHWLGFLFVWGFHAAALIVGIFAMVLRSKWLTMVAEEERM